MKYLVDSDYVADYLGAHPAAIKLLSSFAKDDLSISLITYGEIYEGIHFGRDPQKTTDVFHRFLRPVVILPLTQPIMRQFARIRGELIRTGKLNLSHAAYSLMYAADQIYFEVDVLKR